MRISTAQSYDAAIETLLRRQGSMVEAQEQLTTGKRVNRASDDPAAAARAERALAAEKRADASQRAVNASQTAMVLAESALGDGIDLMQEIRETLLAAGNGSYSDAERRVLADKIMSLRDQLITVANRQDGSGTYLFGGQGADRQPFLETTGGVIYQSRPGEVGAAAGEPLPLTLDGQSAWLSGRTGNGVFVTSPAVSNGTAWINPGQVYDPTLLTGSSYSVVFEVAAGVTTYSILQDGAPTAVAGEPYVAGRAIQVDGLSVTITGQPADADQFDLAPSTADLNVFDMLEQAAAALGTPSRSQSQIAQANSSFLAAVDMAMGQLQAARSQAGETLVRIDSATGRLDDSRLAAQTDRSNAESLDMVRAISDFENKQTGYDAALKSYSMVQRMSLFNYLT